MTHIGEHLSVNTYLVPGIVLFVYVYSLHTGSSIGDPLQSDFFLMLKGALRSRQEFSEMLRGIPSSVVFRPGNWYKFYTK